jgi:3-isopropylmalate/(R)-2-methylmalate dehydratase small subunit
MLSTPNKASIASNPSNSNNSSKVWRLPKDIDTDNLAPGAYMKLSVAEIAKHTLESIRVEFASSVRAGDVIVAGPNFGIGSSREQAAGVLVELGVRAVIAPSFCGLFFRNAFNLGLLLLTCEQAELIGEGEQIHIRQETEEDPLLGKQHSFWLESEKHSGLQCASIPDFLMQMIENGGLMNVLKSKITKSST